MYLRSIDFHGKCWTVVFSFTFLFFDINMPMSVITLLFLLFSIANAVLIKFIIVFLFSLASFWTFSVSGVVWFRFALTNILSGALVPIVFFPEWMQKIILLLPFQSIVNIPTSIYLHDINNLERLKMIGIQLLWIIVLWLVAKFVLNRGMKKMVIFGG